MGKSFLFVRQLWAKFILGKVVFLGKDLTLYLSDLHSPKLKIGCRENVKVNSRQIAPIHVESRLD